MHYAAARVGDYNLRQMLPSKRPCPAPAGISAMGQERSSEPTGQSLSGITS
jgi:hypothetical protein